MTVQPGAAAGPLGADTNQRYPHRERLVLKEAAAAEGRSRATAQKKEIRTCLPNLYVMNARGSQKSACGPPA